MRAILAHEFWKVKRHIFLATNHRKESATFSVKSYSLFEGIKLEVYMLIVRRDTGVPDEHTAFLLPGVGCSLSP
jgi:hypothetical protein